MKKVLFASIVLILALVAFFLIPSDRGNVVKPYQDADSQLLIPQRNVVIITIDLELGGLTLFSEDTISRLEELNKDFN